MSLINDALKKAERQRALEEGDVIPPMPGGQRQVQRQGGPRSVQTMILVGAAAIALIVVSVVVTGVMITHAPELKPATPTRIATDPTPVQAPARIVVQSAPVAISLPQTAAVILPTPTALPKPTPVPTALVSVPAPAVVNPVQSSPAPVLTAQSRTEIVQDMVDKYLVSGVRFAGAESKALIDGHVYKVNDIVDHSIGLKLIKAEADRLTFVDRDGTTYVKTF